jgi:hypothetical protein
MLVALMYIICLPLYAATPVAFVYVSENPGPSPANGYLPTSPITVFSAAADGKLTPVKSSQKTVGIMAGTNGTHFVTLDNYYLHSYSVSSAGVIGSQVSEVDTWAYGDANCGWPINAELDHTGAYVYVVRNQGYLPDGEGCDAIQTFEVSSKGTLTYKGATALVIGYDGEGEVTSRPLLTGNNAFGLLSGVILARESSGTLILAPSATVTGPVTFAPSAPSIDYTLLEYTPDPTNHVAALVDGNGGIGLQLASYTVNSQGDFISTNTWDTMPTVPADAGELGSAHGMVLNPTGTVVALAVDSGIQFYKFNGASPITPLFSIVGESGYFVALAWDKSNHLYALNGQSGKLHVWTVTTKSAVEAPDSPYAMPFNNGAQDAILPTLIVRSN